MLLLEFPVLHAADAGAASVTVITQEIALNTPKAWGPIHPCDPVR